MIGSLISAGVGMASGIIGGIAAGKENKKRQQALDRQKAEAEASFNMDYYADPTKRADTQALLNKVREQYNERSQTVANTAAVMGSTPEAVQAARNANNGDVADVISNIAAQNEQRKESVKSRYEAQKIQLAQQQEQLTSEKAANWTKMLQAGLGAAGSAASSSAVPESKESEEPKQSSDIPLAPMSSNAPTLLSLNQLIKNR